MLAEGQCPAGRASSSLVTTPLPRFGAPCPDSPPPVYQQCHPFLVRRLPAHFPLQGPFFPGYEPTGDPAAATAPGAGLGFERIDHAVFNTHNLMEAVQYMAGALGGWPALQGVLCSGVVYRTGCRCTCNLTEAVQYMAGALGGWPALIIVVFGSCIARRQQGGRLVTNWRGMDKQCCVQQHCWAGCLPSMFDGGQRMLWCLRWLCCARWFRRYGAAGWWQRVSECQGTTCLPAPPHPLTPLHPTSPLHPSCCGAGLHEFGEFTAEDVGTIDSGLNSMVGAD